LRVGRGEARSAHLETQYELAKGVRWPLGGIPNVGVANESYQDAPGFIVVPVGYERTVKMELMGYVSGETGSARLWNDTDGEEVTGSEITFTATSPTLQTTPDLDLVAGKSYKLQIKISDDGDEVYVYGGSLVTQ
jgi:hypothetical protein